MRLIHRFIARRILAVTGVVFAFAAVIVLTTQVLNQVFHIIDASASPLVAVELMVWMFPKVMAGVLPLAWLVGLVQSYDTLHDNSEAVVIVGTGQSPARMLRPAVWLAGGFAALILCSSLVVEPYANRQMRQALYDLRYESLNLVTRDSVLREVEDELYVRGGARQEDGSLKGFFILDRRRAPAETLYIAETVQLIRREGVLQLEMTNGHIYRRDEAGRDSYNVAFKVYYTNPEDFFSDLPGGFGAVETSTAELWRKWNEGAGRKTQAELVRRASDWLYPLVFCALAAWVVMRAQTRTPARRGRFRWTMVTAVGLGAVLRALSFVALGQAGQQTWAVVASFALPLSAVVVFSTLALREARGLGYWAGAGRG